MAESEYKNTKSIRLLTWNLWFVDFLQIERLLAILSYIEPLQPDIIAFQELTKISERFFNDRNIFFSRYYTKVRTKIPDWQWYWEGLYSRLPIGEASTRLPYQYSEMGRGLTLLFAPDLDLLVGCTHLESEFDHSRRRQQFVEAMEHIESFSAGNKILMGDTNTRSGEKLHDLLPPNWRDAWIEMQPNDPGFTVDSRKNPMGFGKRQDRLDRLYYSCRDFKLSRLQLVGSNPITTEYGKSFLPSDHFGLLADFNRIAE